MQINNIEDNLNLIDFNSLEEYSLFVETIAEQVNTFFESTTDRFIKVHAINLNQSLKSSLARLNNQKRHLK